MSSLDDTSRTDIRVYILLLLVYPSVFRLRRLPLNLPVVSTGLPWCAPTRRRGSPAGFTVVEATVAGAIITLFLSSLFVLNSNMIHLLRGASEAANASQELQTNIEKIRLANWTQITDPVWFKKNFFSVGTDAQNNLPGIVESITVGPALSPTSAPAASSKTTPATPPSFTITFQNKVATANPASYSSTDALQQQEMIRVEVTVTWPSLYRSRTRTLTTLVSRWGISK